MIKKCFSKTELKALKLLSKHNYLTINSLAEKLGISAPAASRIVQTLSQKRMVLINSYGITRRISLSENPLAAEIRHIVLKYHHIPWDIVLSGKKMSLLCELESAKDVVELSDGLHIPPPTIYRHLNTLRRLAIVVKRGKKYVLNPKHTAYTDLRTLCRTFEDYILKEKLSLIQRPDSTVIWQYMDEFLVKVNNIAEYLNSVRKDDVRCVLTSVSALGYYGIDIFKIYDVVYVAFENVIPLQRAKESYASKEDVILHLLLDHDERHFEFASVLAKRYQNSLDQDYIFRMGKIYGISQRVRSLMDIIRD